MNALFAAGLFDSPWVIAALVIGSAIANWLAKRRQEKQARNQPEDESPPPASSAPPGEFNLEETLRRLMGEEPPAPSPAPPPLIPRAARRDLPPVQIPTEIKPLPAEWMRQPMRPAVPALRPPIAVAPVSVTAREARQEVEQAEQRFEQLTEQVRRPATVVTHTRHRARRSGAQGTSRWRDLRSVRRAFIASLVFAPPKSFEP
jgi:HAMP domain-containing protein